MNQPIEFIPNLNLPGSFEPGGFADHTTPLIRNCWYVAGLASEISRDLSLNQIPHR